LPQLRVNVHRDAAPVVHDRHRAVGMDGHVDPVTVPGQGLINAVVDDLVHEMVEATNVGRPNVHTRATTDSFQSLQHLDAGCVVLGEKCFSHETTTFQLAGPAGEWDSGPGWPSARARSR